MSVWLSVSVSVCPLTYLKNHVSKFHKIRTSGFVDDATFSHNGPPKNYILRSFLSACLFNTSACKKILFDFKHLQWLDVLSMCIIYLLHPRQQMRNIVMSTLDHSITRVRVCVCLSARISPEPHARILPIFVYVAYGCGSVLHRRRWDTLCTSGFVDDIMFPSYSRPYSDFATNDRFCLNLFIYRKVGHNSISCYQRA